MKGHPILFSAACWMLFIFTAPASVFYVDVNSTNPVPPYADWSTAATNIQDAINASTNGDLILVTNGIYRCVVVTNVLTIQSINGSAVTVINGGNTNNCISLVDGDAISGFTFTNGNGGGVICNSTNSLITNCLIIGISGGGSVYGTYNNCTITMNTNIFGYMSTHSTLNNCIVSNNQGYGLTSCLANNCLICGNTTSNGIVASVSTLFNCTVVINSSQGSELTGVFQGCKAVNSIIYYNGGNVANSSLTNCCFPLYTNNSCVSNPPAFVDALHGNYHLQQFSPCIDAGNTSYVSTATDLDGNPRIFNGAVDIGAYESEYTNYSGFHYVSLSSTNPVSPYTNWASAATNIQNAIAVAQPGETVLVAAGYYTNGGMAVYGQATNRVVITNAITVLGLTDIVSTNMAAGAVLVGDSHTRCAYVGSNAILSGFIITNGYAANGSDPIHEKSGGGIWCEPGGVVSNCFVDRNFALSASGSGGGIYGGTICDSVVVNNEAPQGGGGCSNTWLNCIIAYNIAGNVGPQNGGGVLGAILTNCVLIANQAYNSGGGAAYSSLTSCIVSNNTASGYPAAYGGGVDSCYANNCLIISNYSNAYGGGGYGGTLTNCTLAGNSVAANYNGGGAYGDSNSPIILNTCIISNNTAGNGGGVFSTGSPNLTNGILNNCIITRNTGTHSGGGAVLATMNNCIISRNTVSSGGEGAGVEGGVLNNCLIAGNIATGHGGGVGGSLVPQNDTVLNNCTIVSNTAGYAGGGGGVNFGTLYNCIVCNNSNGNYAGNISLNYCCTTPLPPSGIGNITNDPVFVNLTGGDYHLSLNSPCINSGNNAYVSVTNDLDGNPRIVGGTVDIGAYEYQTPSSVLSYAWLQQYGLPTDGSVDFADLDGSGMNVYQDWVAGLNPTNAASVLALQAPATTNSIGITVTWQSVTNITYYLQSSTNLPVFTTIQSNIVGQAGTTSYTDTTATNGGPYFYRVGVQY